jgi:hypothetical protein
MDKAFIFFKTHTERRHTMATDKQFNVFGVSKLNGEYKVRFANDILRSKVLVKHGHLDVRLEDVGSNMSKYDGIKAIQGLDVFQDAAAQSAIAEYLEEKAPKATVAPVKAPAKAKTAKKAEIASNDAQAIAQARAKAKVAAKEGMDENIPF